MEPDLTAVDDAVAAAGADGYLVHAASTDSNQRYLSGFDAPDSFVTLRTDGATHLLVSGLEYGRARKESRADTVTRLVDYDHRGNIAEYGSRLGKARTVSGFLADRDVASVLVPESFPVGLADGLREEGVGVTAEDEDVVAGVRAVKTDEEVEYLRTAQRANEASMRAAEDLIRAADVVGGVLHYEGDPLTSERVKEEIEVALLRRGCALDETIVACGADGADPHNRGSGPLAAGEPIVIDIFPRDKESKYHADMTRTFVKGEPSEAVRDAFEATRAAFEAALAATAPGATGEDVHDAACEALEDAGYPTLRADPTTETGFIHSTGHGVGLDVHELPRLAPGGEELEPGHAVTIEPGLYDPAFGGIRIEDFVVVTADGYENLTDYPIELVVE